MQQKFFIQPWAAAGDKTAVPDPLQPSGDVSINTGWGFDYQRELGVDPDAKAIGRNQMNWLFGAITENVQQYQTASVPEFISSADNGGSPYSYARGVMVRYRTGSNPFLTYVSKKAATTATPTEGASSADWELLIFERATNAQALAGTDTNTIITPASLAAAIAASSVTVPDATETTKGKAEIATQTETNTGTDDTRIVTPLKLANAIPAASTTQVGRSRFATSAEVTALTLLTVGITPGTLKPLMDTKANLSGANFTGAVSVTGAMTATTFVGNSGGNLAMGTTGAGTVFLRPNGIGSTTGQTSIASNGNMTIGGSCTAAGGFQNGSSRLIKHDLRPLRYGLDAVLGIETAVGKYLPEIDPMQRDRLFVIAEQLREVVPEPVIDNDQFRKGEVIPTVDYMQLIPVLIEAVKELNERLAKLEG